MLEQFSPSAHYVQGFDTFINAPYVFLMQEARELIVQYYSEKYGSKIFLVNGFHKLCFTLAKQDKSSSHYRAGFFVGKINEHSIPIVYIRENGEEALFYADSQGHNNSILAQLKQLTTLPIYSVKEKRQADFYSCAIDALIFLRDCTAMDQEKTHYRLPYLLASLKRRSTQREGYLEVKLPNPLLKTIQQSSFLELHEEKSACLVHKEQTLSDFRKHYSMRNTYGKTQSTYLRIKGIKIAHIIEIQFYLNQLQSQLDAQWTVELRTAFIHQAKYEFAQQGDFFLNPRRAGLYELALYFQKNIKENKNADLRLRAYNFSSVEINKTTRIAETLLQIIDDSTYWKQKSFWGLAPPEGICAMQKAILACPDSLIAKMSVAREVALNRRKSKSIFFLVTGTDERDSLTDDFYKLFSEDWLNTPLFDKIVADWKKFQSPPQETPLPSMEDYKRIRIRF